MSEQIKKVRRILITVLAATMLMSFSFASPSFGQYLDDFWASDPWGPDGVCTRKPWRKRCVNNPPPPNDPVPEPTGALLFAAGGLVLYAGWKRRAGS